MSKFTEGLIEGVVSTAASVVALYIGTNLGLRARKKASDLKVENRIDEDEEDGFYEDPELFND